MACPMPTSLHYRLMPGHRIRSSLRLALIVALLSTVAQSAAVQSRGADLDLKVSRDGHGLETLDGRPFYWLADTAWNLLYALDDNSIDSYARHRHEQGFNVALVQLIGGDPNVPDPAGHPSLDRSPDGRNALDPEFAKGAAAKIDILNRNGIVAGVVLAWSRILPLFFGNPDAAERFGHDVAAALGDRHVVWILGGDVNADDQTVPLWNAVAKGLRAGSARPHLITYHPTRGSSSAAFSNDDPVLDFQSAQSGHSRFRPLSLPTEGPIRHDFAMVPPKPTIDLESGYEGIADGLYRLHPRGTFVEPADRLDDYDIRVRMWSLYLSGAFGYTYGQVSVLLFWEPGKPAAWPIMKPWQTQMDEPGAKDASVYQQIRMRLGAPYLVPNDDLVRESNAKLYDNARTFGGCTPAGQACLIYSAPGMPFTVAGDAAPRGARFSWIDPHSGDAKPASGERRDGGDLYFTPPAPNAFLPVQSQRSLNDWLLLIER